MANGLRDARMTKKRKSELKIKTWPIGRVLAYAKNARLHSDEQIDIVANGVLIAGHCRVLSSKKLGMKTVPVIKLGYLTEQQARALRTRQSRSW